MKNFDENLNDQFDKSSKHKPPKEHAPKKRYKLRLQEEQEAQKEIKQYEDSQAGSHFTG